MAEVLSLAQRLAGLALPSHYSRAEEANGGSGGRKYVAFLPAVVYSREPIFSRSRELSSLHLP
jgi:hypothetical protein